MRAGVPLSNGYGGSEFGNPFRPWDQKPRTSTGPDLDWYWFQVKENSKNVRFEPQGDGSYELVVFVSASRRRACLDLAHSALVVKETDDYDLSMYNVPGEKAFATSDLFEPHPTKPDLWKM